VRAVAPPASRWRRPREYAAAVLAVVPVTAICAWARPAFSDADTTMVFLLGVLLVASRVSRGPSLANVLASVAAFNFFFVEPRYTFHVADRAFLVTFAVMLVVGITVSRMTVRIREETAERAAAAVAAETERTRAELLGAVSHDLRTPLASITGAASELLERSGASAGEGSRELLETIRDEGERMGRLVEGLLALERIEGGGFRPRADWCALEEVIGSSLSRVADRAAAREVRVDLPPEVLLVPGDPALVESVLVNLLENALKFSPPGTPVEIAARREGDSVAVEVRDGGPGFPDGERERIFDRYFRGAAGTAAPGWGLGLAVCRAVVRVHGGTIVARNRPGGGGVVRFTLPAEGPGGAEGAEGAGAPGDGGARGPVAA
jgi:K+-sensing histidine kinase KdpD